MKRELDLICMGRAGVDLYAEQLGAELEDAASFAKYVGGCPANICIGAARLGLKSAMLSRVGDEAMGRFIRKSFVKEGVDISHLAVDKERLTALVLLGVSPPGRFPLLFYRENCADMALTIEDYSDDFLSSAKALLVTGTHCSGEEIFSVTMDAASRALALGTKVLLDIDYRPVLWGKGGHGDGEKRYSSDKLFAERMAEIIPLADLIVGTEEEILAATDSETIEVALSIVRKAAKGIVVRKCGERGAVAYARELDKPVAVNSFPVEIMNVLGAGDGFMSGFLRGYLRDHPIEECLTFANACGALVVARHGCSPAMPYWQELISFLSDPKNRARCERLHAVHNSPPAKGELCLLALDHRHAFEELAKRYERGRGAILKFKGIIYSAYKTLSQESHYRKTGIIVDGEYGKEVLDDARREGIELFRCIESPNSFPLKYLNNSEASSTLRMWPSAEAVKVLCYVSEEAVNEQQIEKLSHLYSATLQSGHRLLIELVDRREGASLSRIYRFIEECYKGKIFPEWWKLQPIEDLPTWEMIGALIDREDPYSAGILLLGEGKSLEELSYAIGRIAAAQPKVRGFAVGRSIWGESAEQWFDGAISDEEAAEAIACRFGALVKNWKRELAAQ